jgi:hypothetical protein
VRAPHNHAFNDSPCGLGAVPTTRADRHESRQGQMLRVKTDLASALESVHERTETLERLGEEVQVCDECLHEAGFCNQGGGRGRGGGGGVF